MKEGAVHGFERARRSGQRRHATDLWRKKILQLKGSKVKKPFPGSNSFCITLT